MNFEDLEKLRFEETELKDFVIVSFGPFDGLDEIHEVDMRLFEEIPEEIGSHDGHEINMDDTDGRLFTYGNDAEILFNVMKPILYEYDFLKTADVYLRFTKNGKEVRNLEFKLSQT